MIESSEKILKIVAAYFVSSIGINQFDEDGQTATIGFHSGYNWEQIKFASAIYSEPVSQTDDGTLYNQQLLLVLAGDEETIQERVKELQESQPVIRFEYDNGTSKIIGDKENYCQVTPDFNSESFETKRELNVTRQSAQPAFFLSE